jgi:flagellar protein FlaJ
MKNKIMRIVTENKSQVVGIVVALVIVLLAYIFLQNSDIFYFILGICFVIAGLPFFIKLIIEGNQEKEIESMFLEFARNLVESVKAGTPISKSILNIRKKDYGKLNPHIEKLANQISLGIPLKLALETFARDLNSITIARAVTIISESEKAGGKIEEILESVAKSVSQVDRLKKERTAAMYSLVVQGYIIFMIFIVIMLVMQFQILPIAAGLGNSVGLSGGDSGMPALGVLGGGGTCTQATPQELARPFLYLLIIQGFFAGLVIGKIAEGKIKSGLKHSFILIVLALLITTGASVFLGK